MINLAVAAAWTGLRRCVSTTRAPHRPTRHASHSGPRRSPRSRPAWAGLLSLLVAAGSAGASAAPAGSTASFVAIDVATGARLIDIEGERLGVPASVTKLLVAIAALELVGPEHRARTTFEAGGTVAKGMLGGDLIVRAIGDPTWSARFDGNLDPVPRRVARQLAAAGLEMVAGAIVIDRSLLPGRQVPTERSWSDLGWARGAPTSALAIDENAVEIAIAPGPSVGSPALARGPRWLTLRNEMKTVAADRHGRGTVDALADPSCGEVVLRGEYPVSESGWNVKVAVPDPDRRAAQVLLDELTAVGIRVTGGIKLVDTAPPRTRVLAEHLSPPLAEWLPAILADSENWLADMLLRHLGAAVEGNGRSEDAAALVARTARERLGVTATIAIEDGSGLSPSGLATARGLAATLASAAAQPWFPQLVEALPNTRTGTLRAWPALPGGVRAKTGTLSRHTALAGYVTRADGSIIAFASLVGPVLDDRAGARRWIAAQLQLALQRDRPPLLIPAPSRP